MRRDAPHVNGSASHEPARNCNVLALSLCLVSRSGGDVCLSCFEVSAN